MKKYNFFDLTILIVTFSTEKKILLNCLNSINRKVKVIIVENSNNFKYKDFFISKFSNVKIYTTGKNLGYGEGNNFGLKLIKSKYVLILNPDTVLDKTFFDNIYSLLKNNSFSIIGCSTPDRDYIPGGYFEKKKNIDLKKKYNKKFKLGLIKVDWVSGHALLINKNNIPKIDIFDKNFFLYFEEFDLCKFLYRINKKVYLSKKLLVHHLGFKSSSFSNPESLKKLKKLREWHWMWSSFYFYKKNFNYLFALFIMSDKLLKSFFKLIFFTFTFDNQNRDKYLFRLLGLLSSMLGFKSFYRVKF